MKRDVAIKPDDMEAETLRQRCKAEAVKASYQQDEKEAEMWRVDKQPRASQGLRGEESGSIPAAVLLPSRQPFGLGSISHVS